MATPHGKLLISSRQNNNGAQTRLVIFLVITVLTAVLLLLAGAGGYAVLIAIIPFLLVLVTVPYALRDPMQVSLFEDGIAFHRLEDNRLVVEATWNEVVNISWDATSATGLAATVIGGLSFGVVGALIGAAIDNARRNNSARITPKTSSYRVQILVNKHKHRFDIDKSYPQFPTIEYFLLKHSAATWHDVALEALKAGKKIRSGKIALTPEIVTNGQQYAEWKQITDVEITDPDRAMLVVRYQDAGKACRFFISNWQRGVALGSVILDYLWIAKKREMPPNIGD